MADQPGIFRRLFGVGRNLVPRGMGTDTTPPPGTVKELGASFTPNITADPRTAPRVTNLAIQEAGALPPSAQEKPTSPEQTFDTSLHPSPDPTAASVIEPGMAVPPEKTQTAVSAARVQQYLLAKFNPIRGLNPRLLSTYLEQSDLGFLRQAQLVWNKIRERDDQIQAVAVNRELRPTDMDWEIVPVDESPEAMQHKLALEEFYNNCSVTHALEQNTRGGVALLIRQMMRAVGDKFSVHEIVWRPDVDLLTAEFRFVPLWFFENRTGQLRYLPYELALQGIPLEPGGWCVHAGEGLFQATSIAYLYKQMALKDWVNYSEKFGMPFLHGKTTAGYLTQEWNDFAECLRVFASDGAAVTNTACEIEPITAGNPGNMPQPELCDRMDRAIARLWKGGDLSTMSRAGGGSASGSSSGGVGASNQHENEDDLAKADAERISETLQFYVDSWVIRYKFGADKPLAKFTLLPKESIDTDGLIKKYQFLMGVGVPVAIQDLVEIFGVSAPDDGEELATKPAPPPAFGGGGGFGRDPQQEGLGNVSPAAFKRYQVSSVELVARAQSAALAPVRERLKKLVDLPPEERAIAAKKLQADLPRMFQKIAGSPDLVKAIQDSIGTAIAIGAGESAEKRKHINGHVRETFHR
jgi:phage gp29-like protein